MRIFIYAMMVRGKKPAPAYYLGRGRARICICMVIIILVNKTQSCVSSMLLRLTINYLLEVERASQASLTDRDCIY